MSALLTLRNVFWAATSLGEVVLIFYLIQRRLVRSHFWLFLYLCCTVIQSALGVLTYSLLDFGSAATRDIIWSSQAVVITMRFSAVCEMALRILARYVGIWALAQRVLLNSGLTLGYLDVVAAATPIPDIIIELKQNIKTVALRAAER